MNPLGVLSLALWAAILTVRLGMLALRLIILMVLMLLNLARRLR